MNWESAGVTKGEGDGDGFSAAFQRWEDSDHAWDLRQMIADFHAAPDTPQPIQKRSGHGPGRVKPRKVKVVEIEPEQMSYDELARRLERYCV